MISQLICGQGLKCLIQESLKDHTRELRAELLKHAGSDCGNMPDATNSFGQGARSFLDFLPI